MHSYCTVSKAAGGKRHFHALLMEKETPKTFVSAEQRKRKLFRRTHKLLSCSAAICSDGTEGKEGDIPAPVMLM